MHQLPLFTGKVSFIGVVVSPQKSINSKCNSNQKDKDFGKNSASFKVHFSSLLYLLITIISTFVFFGHGVQYFLKATEPLRTASSLFITKCLVVPDIYLIEQESSG